jgi:hypothetical protein
MSVTKNLLTAAAICFGAMVGVGAVGCKGETETKPDPQTKTDLDNCNKNLADKDALIKTLRDDNANLMRGQGSAGGEILVTYENDILKIKSNKNTGGTAPVVDQAAAQAASTQFVDLVQKSRGAIQKCYEQALKKNTGLQAKTITLRVGASFGGDGKLQHASFDGVSDTTFEQCMQTVAGKWVMPTNSPAMTFRAPVSLTPS